MLAQRCVSLLKILLSNACKYDCAYCVNRRSNDIPRATFTPKEVIDLTLEFYRRNYIEGLFLSSAVVGSPDATMERLVRVAKELRRVHRFGGYIHLKSIPGASEALLHEAGLYADRTSVNIEVPSERSLTYLAPEKNYASVYAPMNYFAERKIEYGGSRGRYTPNFLPAGQSTQMIVGASGESDLQILTLSAGFYKQQRLKRVYFSGYVPVNADKRLPALTTKPPLAFIMFTIVGLILKKRERRYFREGGSEEGYNAFWQTNANSWHFSLFTSIVVFITALLDIITYFFMTVFLSTYWVDVSTATDAEIAAAVDKTTQLVDHLAIGDSINMLLLIPFLLLFSYTRKHKNNQIDALIPLAGIVLIILIYLEGEYRLWEQRLPHRRPSRIP